MSRRLDTIAIETFITIAELGSFSKAADKLLVTQPSISGRIQRLEAELGVKLLERTTHSVVLTEAGRDFLMRVRSPMSDLKAAVEEFGCGSDATRRLAVAASPMVAATVLPPVLNRFRNAYPEAELVLRDTSTIQALNDLGNGAADFAIMAYDGDDRRFAFRPLFADECVVVVPQGHALAARRSVRLVDLAGYDLVLPGFQAQLKLILAQEFRKQGIEMRRHLSAASVHTVMRMVEAGMGISVVSRIVFQGARMAGVAMIPIEGSRVLRTFGVLTRRGRRLSKVEAAFCRYAEEEFAGMPPHARAL